MKSRVESSHKNINTAILTKLIVMGIAFFLRTVFIKILGEEYTGINSLYNNILSILSLAEFGIGNIASYYMYNALVNNDNDKILMVVVYFKKIYRIIMALILMMGLMLVPILHLIVNSSLNRQQFVLYYILFLLNSVASYIYEYRIQVITADQKNYIISLSGAFSTVVMYFFQLILLFITRNYLLYLLVQLSFTVINRVILNNVACRHYEFLKSKEIVACRNPNTIIDTDKIKKDMPITFLSKVASVLVNQTDSILISILFSTTVVGYYSNYMIIMSYITNFIGITYGAISASYGNLVASGNKKRILQMFDFTKFIFWMLATGIVVCYACVIQDFIPIWIGEKYLIQPIVVIAICLSCMVNTIYTPVLLYRNVMGIFREGAKAQIAVVIMNIVLSIFLGKKIGVAGVIFATPISKLFSVCFVDTLLVYKRLKKSIIDGIRATLLYFIQFLTSVLLSYYVTSKIKIGGLAGIFIELIVCICIVGLIAYLINRKSEEYNYMISLIFRKNTRKNN